MTDTEGHPADDRSRPAAQALGAFDALVEVAVRTAAAERIAPPAAATAVGALSAIADATAAVLRVAAVSLAIHDRATDRLVFQAAAGPQGGAVVGLSIAAHDGIAGYVFSTGQALAIAEVAADPRFERSTAERTGYIPTSLLAVPLVDDAGIVGVLEVLDRLDGAPFDLSDVDLATRMASAGTAVARAGGLVADASVLLISVLATIGRTDGGPPTDADIDILMAEVADRLSDTDPLWRLADRIGRLRAADPDDLELAIAWLDVLMARTGRRAGARRLSDP